VSPIRRPLQNAEPAIRGRAARGPRGGSSGEATASRRRDFFPRLDPLSVSDADTPRMDDSTVLVYQKTNSTNMTEGHVVVFDRKMPRY